MSAFSVQRFLQLSAILALGLFILVSVSTQLGKAFPSGVLAFDSNRNGNYDIYMVDVRQNITLNITRHPAQDRNPSWSPDGRYLAFESVQRGNFGNSIYIYDLWRGALRRVVPGTIRGVQPSWSPSGNALVFAGRTDEVWTNDLYIVYPSDSGATRLTYTEEVYEYNPSWSPDGNYIVYGEYDPVNNAPAFIRVIPYRDPLTRLAAQNIPLESVQINDIYGASDPTWVSPREVMFVAGQPRQHVLVSGIGADDPDREILTLPFSITEPTLSPDGNWIAYVPDRRMNSISGSIYLTHLYTQQTRMLGGSYFSYWWDSSPVWMPSPR